MLCISLLVYNTLSRNKTLFLSFHVLFASAYHAWVCAPPQEKSWLRPGLGLIYIWKSLKVSSRSLSFTEETQETFQEIQGI